MCCRRMVLVMVIELCVLVVILGVVRRVYIWVLWR